MFDPQTEARHIAAYSLGQLLQKDSSTEAGVRAVLRISTMLRHSWWQIWAFIQVTDFYEPDAMNEADRLIEAAFPDADRRRELVESALASARATRRVELSDPPAYNLADIGDLERDLPIFEARLLKKISVERFRQRDSRRTILNRVKNKVQFYLMAIENGTAIPRDDVADQ